MRNKPEVQIALLATAILHVRSKRAESRTALSKLMNLSPSTAGLYIDDLIEKKLVVESGLDQGAKGRPKRHLEVCSDAGWFAGIEFNADRLRAISIDFAGKQIKSIVTPFAHGVTRDDVLREIDQSFAVLRQDSQGTLLSIGVGVPGVVDPLEGIAINYSFIPDWQNVPIVQRLQERNGVAVKIDNNLRAIALAERWFGGGLAHDDYTILGPRSGFGVAMVKHGQLICGAHHGAGEIGRWHWPFEGHTGELHDNLSAPSIWRRLNSESEKAFVPRDLYAAYESMKDDVAERPQWNSVVSDFGRLLGYLQLLLDSKMYFLHGPLTALGDVFCKAVSDRALEWMPGLATKRPNVVPSSMGDDAGALGAASLAMESWTPSLDSL
jgi:predicted NBD/HSP70 family sugar kinase